MKSKISGVSIPPACHPAPTPGRLFPDRAIGGWSVLNEVAISRLQAERVLNTAVDFIHAGGGADEYTLRANYACRKVLRRKHLKTKFCSYNYDEYELDNTWKSPKEFKEQASCALNAMTWGSTVLGAHPDDTLRACAELGLPLSCRTQPMIVYDPRDETRTVLCVPVRKATATSPWV